MQVLHTQKLESVGRLAGGIAHDFNNLLTVMLGHVELTKLALERGSGPATSLDRALEAGQSAAALTRQLLMFARRGPAEPRVVQLNDVVTRTHRIFERIIGENIRLTLALDSALEPVCLDEGQLEQVLLNLVVNARDAMPKGGTLRIATENLAARPVGVGALAEAHAYVRLSVSDTGTGMAPEVAARVFEPFFTTKRSGRRKRHETRHLGGAGVVQRDLGERARAACAAPWTRI